MQGGNVLFALGLTLLAGLCTVIGSGLAFFTKKTNTKFLSIALGFSAGVMIYISMAELFVDARTSLTDSLGLIPGSWAAVAAFFAGVLVIAAIDWLIPEYGNPHGMRKIEEGYGDSTERSSLFRVGVLTAIVIGIHNFPEGIVTFASSVNNVHLGLAIAIAIAIHNIPEGISVSVPVYCATGSRRKAFMLSLLSGLAEPLGAVLAYLVLVPYLNEVTMGLSFAFVAGIMIFISLDELLPTARRYGEHHLAMYGLIAGMMVMAVSLLLFK